MARSTHNTFQQHWLHLYHQMWFDYHSAIDVGDQHQMVIYQRDSPSLDDLSHYLAIAHTAQFAALAKARERLQHGTLGPDGQVIVDAVSTAMRKIQIARGRLKDVT